MRQLIFGRFSIDKPEAHRENIWEHKSPNVFWGISMKKQQLSAFALSMCFGFYLPLNLAVAAPSTSVPAAWISELSLDQKPTLFVTPSPEGRKPFADAMDAANTSLRLYMYRLTDGWMVQKLKAAQARGVKVQIILDPDKMKPANTKKIVDGMMAEGIEVRGGSPRFTMSHAKTLVIDDSWALVTTMNLTWTFATSRGFGVEVHDKSAISEIVKVFEVDWNLANDPTGRRPLDSIYSDANLVWSPGNSEDKLIDLVRSSKKVIEVLVENLGATPLLEELSQAAKRGVKVKVITPLCLTSVNPLHNYQYIQKLVQGGIEVRSVPLPHTAEHPYSHAKFMAIDAKYVYLGSQNFSKNSLQKARELGIVFDDVSVYRQLAEVWDQDWKVSIEVPATVDKSTCPAFD